MICDEDPLRRRPRESTARRKRQERCVWMARKMTEWPSKRGPITKIMPSDGCIGDTVPLAVGKWYDFHEFGWYMGNVGLVPTITEGSHVGRSWASLRLGARLEVMPIITRAVRRRPRLAQGRPKGRYSRLLAGVGAACRCPGIARATPPTQKTRKDDHTCHPTVIGGTSRPRRGTP